MGCIQSKSRNNKLNPVSKSTEILTKTNPLSSSLLGEEYSTHDSEQDPEFRRVSSGYSAPAVAHRTSSGTRRLDTFASDANTDDEGTSNPMNTPSSTVVDNLISMDGMDVPPNGQPTASPVRAVAGTTILGFEHPFKQESFKKRGQMVKSWKRRYFVMDGGELLYFKDSSLSEKNGEVTLCGAVVSYTDDSTASGGAIIEVHSGKRDLLLECGSSAVAEDWTSAIYDVIINEDLAYLRNHFPAAPPSTAAFNSIKELRRFQKFSSTTFGNSTVIGMCEMITMQYRSALDVLREGVECILFGVDGGGRTVVQSAHMKLSDDGRGLLWCAMSVLKKQYSRKGSTAGRLDDESPYNSVPFDSICDIIVGKLTDQTSAVDSSSLTSDAVISIVTRTHTLEFELDVSEVATSSCYIGDETLHRINAKLSSDTAASDMRMTSSAFSRPSSMFSFGGETSDVGAKRTAEELASCPQVVSRHRFYRALRMVILIHGHIRMVNFVRTTLINSGASSSSKGVAVPSGTSLGSRKRSAGMRPVERARDKVLV